MDPSMCSVCFDDLTPETTVTYRQHTDEPQNFSNSFAPSFSKDEPQNFSNSFAPSFSKDEEWLPFPYCKGCMEYLKDAQWDMYIQGLKKADCEATLKGLIKIGPPVNFRDVKIANGEEIYEFKCNSEVISGKLANSFDGEKRNALYSELKKILPSLHDEKQETDEFSNYVDFISKTLAKFSL